MWQNLHKQVSLVQDILFRVGRGRWKWSKNIRCKYVCIRVDMRDGNAILLDRDNKPITFEELDSQSITSVTRDPRKEEKQG